MPHATHAMLSLFVLYAENAGQLNEYIVGNALGEGVGGTEGIGVGSTVGTELGKGEGSTLGAAVEGTNVGLPGRGVGFVVGIDDGGNV